MQLQTKKVLSSKSQVIVDDSRINESLFSKDYVDFLSEAGWILEKKLPSNRNNYSDLLEDTEWKSNNVDFRCSKHYRRDLDALS
mgnify:CR=1 FL=1